MAETTICPICAYPTTDTSGCHPRCLRDDRRYAYTDKVWQREKRKLAKRMERNGGIDTKCPDGVRNCKRVRCVETGEVFESMREAERSKGIKAKGLISASIRDGHRAGGYRWEVIDDA